MSTLVSDLFGEKAATEPREWLESIAKYMLLVIGFSAAAALALDKAYNGFVAGFTFLNPLGGFWACMLYALGAITVGIILRRCIMAIFGRDDTKEDISLGMQLVVIGALAWFVTEAFI